MGMFHMIMTFMHVLYKRFASAGLKDALIQSAVVAEGSVGMALRGKSYTFYEALMRIALDKLAEKVGKDKINLFVDTQTDPDIVLNNISYDTLRESSTFQTFYNQFLDLKILWNNSCFALPKFWLSFIDMVGLLLNTIYACRLGRWELPLECIRNIIPYAFAYNHVNYARYLTVMLGDM